MSGKTAEFIHPQVHLLVRMLRRNWRILVAVLGGNLLYFGVLYPYLPQAARHRPDRLDWGLVVDFWICLALFGLFTFSFRRKP